MTTDEAKFILSAFRPSGSDTGDAAFGEALRFAGDDPALGAWFAQSRAHDRAVASKLGQVAPPAGLREAILAGGRVGDSKKSSGLGWGWIAGLAAAAAAAIVVFSTRAPARPDSGASALAGFAISDMVNEKHGGRGEPAGALIEGFEIPDVARHACDVVVLEILADAGQRMLHRDTRLLQHLGPADAR